MFALPRSKHPVRSGTAEVNTHTASVAIWYWHSRGLRTSLWGCQVPRDSSFALRLTWPVFCQLWLFSARLKLESSAFRCLSWATRLLLCQDRKSLGTNFRGTDKNLQILLLSYPEVCFSSSKRSVVVKPATSTTTCWLKHSEVKTWRWIDCFWCWT